MKEWLVELALSFREDARDWCRDKNAWVRLPLLLYLAYAGIRHIANPLYRSWFSGITLVFHEMGHIVFIPFGRTLTILGGSIFQLLIPFVAAVYLLVRQRDYFGLAVGLSWLAFSQWDLATYVADASREQLPLVGFSDHPEHDWSTLLTQWHLLNSDQSIAFGIRCLAFVTWLGAMALGGALCFTMARSPPDSRSF